MFRYRGRPRTPRYRHCGEIFPNSRELSGAGTRGAPGGLRRDSGNFPVLCERYDPRPDRLAVRAPSRKGR
jgi:hypothetical protein